MTCRYRYDYYKVSLPGDLCKTLEGLLGVAINRAQKGARLHCFVCDWTAVRVAGNVGDQEVCFKVTRRRLR